MNDNSNNFIFEHKVHFGHYLATRSALVSFGPIMTRCGHKLTLRL